MKKYAIALSLVLACLSVGVLTAHAGYDLSNPTMPYTAQDGQAYTDFARGCANGGSVGAPCSVWVFIFFNSSAHYNWSGVTNLVGSGNLIATSTNNYIIGMLGNSGDATQYYPCSDSSFTNCTWAGVSSGAVPVLDVPGAGNSDAAEWFYSSRSVVDENGTQLYAGYTPPAGGNGTDTSTHFILTHPTNGSTVSTTTNLGARIYANATDFTSGTGYGRLHIHGYQNSAFACTNSVDVYDAVDQCSGSNSPALPFDFDFGTTTLTQIVSGSYDFSNVFTFPGGGKWTITYSIQNVSVPWYCPFGICHNYTTLISTTTTATIGQLSYMDRVQAEIASTTGARTRFIENAIGGILASTTASLKSACTPFSGSFDVGDCLTLTLWPGVDAISTDFSIIRNMPPWGYAFRVYDILSATSTATTTLPGISYTFAAGTPMAALGEIHFDPFQTIKDSGTLIDQMTSDRPDHKTVWDIMMPFVRIFIYLVLFMMISHDITGIHSGDYSVSTKNMNKRQSKGVKDDSYAYKEKLYNMSNRK